MSVIIDNRIHRTNAVAVNISYDINQLDLSGAKIQIKFDARIVGGVGSKFTIRHSDGNYKSIGKDREYWSPVMESSSEWTSHVFTVDITDELIEKSKFLTVTTNGAFGTDKVDLEITNIEIRTLGSEVEDPEVEDPEVEDPEVEDPPINGETMITRKMNIDLSISPKRKNPLTVGVQLSSYDKNFYEFEISFLERELKEGDTVNILTVFESSERVSESTTEIRDGSALFSFDTTLIDRDEEVTNYVYLKIGGSQAEIGAFRFDVKLSEIDKGARVIAKAYDESYESLIQDFEKEIRGYLPKLETINQEESTRQDEEAVRVSNEKERIANEQARELAELKRNVVVISSEQTKPVISETGEALFEYDTGKVFFYDGTEWRDFV